MSELTPETLAEWRRDAEHWRDALPTKTDKLQGERILALLDALDEAERERNEAREALARVEDDRDALLLLAQEAIQAHRDLHQVYGNTSACGGGIGGAAMTQHCGVTCGYFEKHEADNDHWHRVESAYFRRQDGDPEWGAALRGPSDTEGQA